MVYPILNRNIDPDVESEYSNASNDCTVYPVLIRNIDPDVESEYDQSGDIYKIIDDATRNPTSEGDDDWQTGFQIDWNQREPLDADTITDAANNYSTSGACEDGGSAEFQSDWNEDKQLIVNETRNPTPKECEDGRNLNDGFAIHLDSLNQYKDSASHRKRRGQHVKEKPEMPKKARDGITHWNAMAVTMESKWNDRAIRNPEFAATFAAQKSAARTLGSKLRCLLLAIQLSADDGLLTDVDHAAAPGGEGFFGWTRFTATPAFRARLVAMFGGGHEKTLQATFISAGLVAAGRWQAGWQGMVAFEYRRRQGPEPGLAGQLS
jgi:hypothetical protein